jgi:hypothetical protein
MAYLAVVSAYSAEPPDEAARTKIRGGPIYDLKTIRELAARTSAIVAWTAKCRRDIRALFSNEWQAVGTLLGSLEACDYLHSEWCENAEGFVAACDAYAIEREETTQAGRDVRVAYFLKFAISTAGSLILLVSCHLSS